MAISIKKRKQVTEAIGSVSLAMLQEYAPDTLEHAPESWDQSSRQIFDLVTAFEIKAQAAVDGVLSI